MWNVFHLPPSTFSHFSLTVPENIGTGDAQNRIAPRDVTIKEKHISAAAVLDAGGPVGIGGVGMDFTASGGVH